MEISSKATRNAAPPPFKKNGTVFITCGRHSNNGRKLTERRIHLALVLGEIHGSKFKHFLFKRVTEPGRLSVSDSPSNSRESVSELLPRGSFVPDSWWWCVCRGRIVSIRISVGVKRSHVNDRCLARLDRNQSPPNMTCTGRHAKLWMDSGVPDFEALKPPSSMRGCSELLGSTSLTLSAAQPPEPLDSTSG